jgi:hypothetical protein
VAEEEKQFDYLAAPADTAVLKNLSDMGEHLKGLRTKFLEAEAIYEAAKKEYEYYSSSVLPMVMFNAGVQEVKLMSGGTLTYQRKFHCTPNKNEADKAILAEWLRAHNAPDKLIQVRAVVDKAQINHLEASAIPYTKISDFNTNSLKAFLTDLIGAKGGTPQVQITEIPDCAHFSEDGSVSIEV